MLPRLITREKSARLVTAKVRPSLSLHFYDAMVVHIECFYTVAAIGPAQKNHRNRDRATADSGLDMTPPLFPSLPIISPSSSLSPGPRSFFFIISSDDVLDYPVIPRKNESRIALWKNRDLRKRLELDLRENLKFQNHSFKKSAFQPLKIQFQV